MSEYDKNSHRYDDILYLPHFQSATRPHMSLEDRAAQFSPFAALTGHEDAILETARITEEKLSLDTTQIEKLNEKLQYLAAHLSEKQMVTITYFKPDLKKQGGAYVTDLGTIKKIDSIEQIVIMDSGMKIPMGEVLEIQIGEQ